MQVRTIWGRQERAEHTLPIIGKQQAFSPKLHYVPDAEMEDLQGANVYWPNRIVHSFSSWLVANLCIQSAASKLNIVEWLLNTNKDIIARNQANISWNVLLVLPLLLCRQNDLTPICLWVHRRVIRSACTCSYWRKRWRRSGRLNLLHSFFVPR